MRPSEGAFVLSLAWVIAVAHALIGTLATWAELRRLSLRARDRLFVLAGLPGCILFAELAIRNAVQDGEVRLPEDLCTLGVACLGSFGGLVCIVCSLCGGSERATPPVWFTRVSWMLAWAASSAVACSMAVAI